MSDTDELPRNLYRAAQVRELDRIAIKELGIPGLTLMERAGAAGFTLLRRLWPEAHDITVVCGIGNNGGDGYVLARHARQAGKAVRVLQLGDAARIKGDALANFKAFVDSGGLVEPFEGLPADTDVIVDAIFGTGLERELSGSWRQAVEQINQAAVPVLALDLPSGLHADSGRILGVAVAAAASISFIGLKLGMYTGAGPDCCGHVYFDDLAVPEVVYRTQGPAALWVDWQQQACHFPSRRRSAHKGDFGHVLVIGGDHGLSGAARMAAEAGARRGAGLVSIATRPEHAALLSAVRPELMSHGITEVSQLTPLLRRASVVAIGPGLGQSTWARRLLARVLDSDLPLVVDADALNLLACEPVRRARWILTPHPGEAGRLLGLAAAEVQADRLGSVGALQQRYGGVVVLKGAGSLILGEAGQPASLCTDGNPGMASGGMGDVLTGIIASLLAQGLSLERAAVAGVCLHGAAADRAAQAGERGLLATDLLPLLRPLVNPVPAPC